MRRIRAWSVLLATLALVPAGPVGPAVAGGVRAVRVATGLASPVGFTFLPDGRIAYLERHTGWLRFLDPRTDVDRPVYRVTNVNSDGERGALGVAVHPNWPDSRFIYLFATRNTGNGLRNQVLRVRVENGEGTAVRTLLSASGGPAPHHKRRQLAGRPARAQVRV